MKGESEPFKKGKKLGGGGQGELYLLEDNKTVVKVSPRKRNLAKAIRKAQNEQSIFKLLYPSTPLEIRITEKSELGSAHVEYTLIKVPGSDASWLYNNPEALDNMRQMPFSHRVYALTTITTQLETLHSNNIIHNDIKSENILISNVRRRTGLEYNVPFMSLIDTGLSFRTNNDFEFDCVHGTMATTTATAAPEVLLDTIGYFTSDIYSISPMIGKILGANVVCAYEANIITDHFPQTNVKPEELKFNGFDDYKLFSLRYKIKGLEKSIKKNQSTQTKIDQLKLQLTHHEKQAQEYHEQQRFHFSGVAQEVDRHLMSINFSIEDNADTQYRTSGHDILMLLAQMTKINPYDRPTASELTAVFTMLYNLVNAFEMIKRYNKELEDSNNEDKAILKSALKDYLTVESQLKNLPDDHHHNFVSRYFLETKKSALRRRALQIQRNFLNITKNEIENDPNRLERDNEIQYGQMYLNSLQDQARYYSLLLKACINDLRLGQHRNGVEAVRFCFDKQYNYNDSDAMSLLSRLNGGTHNSYIPILYSGERKRNANDPVIKNLILETGMNKPNKKKLQYINLSRKYNNLPPILYNEQRGFHFDGMPQRYCIKLMRYFENKIQTYSSSERELLHLQHLIFMKNKFLETMRKVNDNVTLGYHHRRQSHLLSETKLHSQPLSGINRHAISSKKSGLMETDLDQKNPTPPAYNSGSKHTHDQQQLATNNLLFLNADLSENEKIKHLRDFFNQINTEELNDDALDIYINLRDHLFSTNEEIKISYSISQLNKLLVFLSNKAIDMSNINYNREYQQSKDNSHLFFSSTRYQKTKLQFLKEIFHNIETKTDNGNSLNNEGKKLFEDVKLNLQPENNELKLSTIEEKIQQLIKLVPPRSPQKK